MINQFNSLITDGTSTAQRAIQLAAVAGIGVTYWRSKAAVPTVISALLGIFVIWVVHNTGVLEKKIGEDLNPPTEELGAPAEMVDVLHSFGLSVQVVSFTDSDLEATPSQVVVELPERVEW